MKKNELWSGVCESYTHDGMGVVKKDGFPFFVKGLLRGEKAMIRTVKLKKTYGFGKVEELLDESAARARRCRMSSPGSPGSIWKCCR